MYSHILVPIDVEEPSSWAKSVPVAQSMVQTFGSSLTLCTVVSDTTAALEAQWSRLSYQALIDRASAKLALIANDLGLEDTPRKVGIGSIYGGILAIAAEEETDLIVLASHRPQMKDWLIGANASRVVRHAPCSVLVVRD